MKNKLNWASRLNKLQNYQTALESSKELFEPNLPDGRYQAKITNAEISESKTSKRLQIVIDLEVVDHPELEGETCKSFAGLEGDSLGYTLAMLSRLGYEPSDDPKDLESLVLEISKSDMIVNIRVKDGFTNIMDKAEGQEGEGKAEDNESEETVQEEPEEEVAEEQEEAEEETSGEIVEGTLVQWKSKATGKNVQGEVIEIMEESNQARIDVGDGKIFKVSMDILEIISSSESEEETEESEESEEVEEEEEQEEKPKKSRVKQIKKTKKINKKKR